MSVVLFDIDGTLLLTHGEGMRAMQDAGRELYHPQFSVAGVDFSGRLDPLIWRQLCEMNAVTLSRRNGEGGPARSVAVSIEGADDASVEAGDDHDVDLDHDHDRFRRAYAAHLRRRLDSGARVTRLPGVNELLSALQADARVTLGLVTGNYPETGQLKIERAGIDFSMFTVFGWGCDGSHRRDLPAKAMAHCRKVVARQVHPRDAIIIGDTPHDIDCARHNGCRSIGVATGAFSVEELREHGADMVASDLSDTHALMEFFEQGIAR